MADQLPHVENPDRKTIRVWLNTGMVGSEIEATFEVDSDASDEQIDEIAREEIFNQVSWSWEEVPRG